MKMRCLTKYKSNEDNSFTDVNLKNKTLKSNPLDINLKNVSRSS